MSAFTQIQDQLTEFIERHQWFFDVYESLYSDCEQLRQEADDENMTNSNDETEYRLREAQERIEQLIELRKRMQWAHLAAQQFNAYPDEPEFAFKYAHNTALVMEQCQMFIPKIPIAWIQRMIDGYFSAIPIYVKAIGDIFTTYFNKVDKESGLRTSELKLNGKVYSCTNGTITDSDIGAINKLKLNANSKSLVFRRMCHYHEDLTSALMSFNYDKYLEEVE